MSAYRVSLANRRMILLAVLSLIASLLTVNFNAPSASATGENLQFNISADSVSESAGTATVEVLLTANEPNLVADVSVQVAVAAGGTAGGSGDDYTYATDTVTFEATPTLPLPAIKFVTITIEHDTVDEADETINFELTGELPMGTPITGNTTHTLTILDDDDPALVINDAPPVTEGEDAVFSVTRGGGSNALEVSVLATTSSGSATQGSGGSADFDGKSETVTILAGQDSANFTVATTDDGEDEGQEQFTVGLSAPVGATIGTGTATGTINDNDDPGLVINNAPAVTEGGDAVFTVDRGGGSNALQVSVLATTVAGTATEGTGGSADYDGKSETVTILAGNDSADFTVVTTDDSEDEGQEQFTVNLSGAVGATIATGTATGSINDNDDPELSITDASPVLEGSIASFTVTRNGADDLEVSATASTRQLVGGATGGGVDYEDKTATVTIPAGDLTGTFTVTTNTDLVHEATEAFAVDLSSPAGATIGTGTATGTITDDDNVTVAFTDPSSNPLEDVPGSPPTVTVTGLDVGNVLHDAVTVDFGSTGTASVGTDFTLGASLTIPAGVISGPIPIPLTIATDVNHEADETIVITMTHSSGPADVSASPHTVTIDDDDDVTVDFTLPSSSVAEDRIPPTHEPTITIDIPGTSTALVSDVVLAITATLASTATGGGVDYTLTTATVTIPATTVEGPNSKVTVTLNDDDLQEDPDEIVVLSMSVTSGPAVLGTEFEHTATIIDDESPNIVITEVGGTIVSETGSTDTFTVNLTSAPPTGTVTVTLTEGLAGDEFNIDESSLTFTTSTWSTPRPVIVTGLNDVDIDGDQTGRVDLSASGPGYTGVTNQLTLSILDDDTATYTFAPTSVSVAEGGASTSYTVVLDARPTSTVTVNLTTGGEVGVSPTSVVFTTSDWLTPRTITAAAVNDDLVDGTLADTIVHTASSTDTDFNGIIDVVGATVTDDDEEGYDIDLGTALAVIEGGDTDTYTIALTAEPLNDVIVTITTDGQTVVDPAVLTFTRASWDVAQTVTVAAIDDGIPEVNPHPSQIGHATTSADPTFDGMTATIVADVGDAGALLTTLEGPTKGAPGHEAVFTAMLNAGGVGAVQYTWTAFYRGNNVGSGSGSTFKFTPTIGGVHQIQVIVSDDNGQQPADFILFTSLGDSGTSIFVGDIVWLAEEGITKGCNPPANDLFCPNDIVTREQMAAFLVRFLGLTDNGGGNTFVDDNGSIFENDIAKLAQAGITRGCNPPTNDRFCPTDRVTREQMAAFLVRALKLTDNGGGNTFTDDNGSIFENDIAKLAAAGITRGCNPPANTQFCPKDFVTRGQMAAFLRRADAILNS